MVLIIAIKVAAKQRGPRLFFFLVRHHHKRRWQKHKTPSPAPARPPKEFLWLVKFRQKAEIKNSKNVIFDVFSRQQEVRGKKKQKKVKIAKFEYFVLIV